MKNTHQILFFSIILLSKTLFAQEKATELDEVLVKGYKTVNGVGHLVGTKNAVIYAGKKSEVVMTDSLDANKAINNTRQILGRIPGLNIVETESSGFTANGIATRGLNPSQSVEMNTRQNGYNISADVYGYNESYYLPPMEAVSRIEFVRGAASLQFGSQFGGLVNYVLKEAPKDKPLEFTTAQTLGSFGMFNSFNALGANYKKFSFYGYVQYRNMDGYRPNSQQWQLSGFGKLNFKASEKLNIGLEYSLLRNRLQMPGGLTDKMFDNDPRSSTRARNWLKSPWNIVTAYANYTPSKESTLSVKTSFLFSNRSLVWRNEDGGPEATDGIDPVTLDFVPREVGIENMHNTTTEVRFSQQYQLGKQKSTLAAGVRQSYGWFTRQGGGEGTTGSDFDLSITGNWGYDLDFSTTNFAPFVENMFKITDAFSITPGIRFEYLKNTIKGHKEVEGDIQKVDQLKARSFVLLGTGLEYKVFGNANLYANISQAYRPIDYSQLEPFGVTSKIDSNLKDSKGFNSDLGFRSTVKNYLNFDVSVFYLAYNDRIGVTLASDEVTGDLYSLRKNIANSVHKGVECYAEFNLLKYLNQESKSGLSLFNSYSYTDARYVSGPFDGKRVEAAARIINRTGLIFSTEKFSTTFQVNHVGDAFGDASNARVSDDPVAGYIPAYTVLDWSASAQLKNYSLKFGCNNITDKAYFTRRTDEYPGPGIIPAVGRSFYAGFVAKF
ncbi:MAG: TonB-dependent receptor [Flavobacteriaceae bacterium]